MKKEQKNNKKITANRFNFFQDLLNDFQDASGNGDEWINFEEFCQGVASLFEAPVQQQQQQQQQQQLQHQTSLQQTEETFDLHNSSNDEGKC